MNYIAIFAFDIFEHNLKISYKFLSFLCKFYLNRKFKGQLEGLEEFIYKFDKYLQLEAPKIWQKLRKSKTSSIHFIIPLFITLFSSFMKGGQIYFKFITRIWDIVLVKDLEIMIFILYKLIKLQEKGILKMSDNTILQSIRKMEDSPIVVCGENDRDEAFVELFEEGFFSKGKLLMGGLDGKAMEKLEVFLCQVRRVLRDFWVG